MAEEERKEGIIEDIVEPGPKKEEVIGKDIPQEGQDDNALKDNQLNEEQEDQSSVPPLEDFEEDLGISITDDELWDESGGLDEIPLFDDITEDNKEPLIKDTPEPESQVEPPESDEETVVTESKDESGDELVSGSEEHEDQVEEEELEEEKDGSLLEWFNLTNIFSFVNSIIFLVGIFVLFKVLKTEPPPQDYLKHTSQQTLNVKTSTKTSEGKIQDLQRLDRGFYTMNLDPFIIPAQMNGELVFFKLKAELVFDDVASKRAFSEKVAWVRDIIYSELKGIDISSGLSQRSLFSYRKPIMDRLNKFLAPNKVEDLRLVGFVLK
ncbi:hypothetical protein DBT_0547 [Dissulfuribacter thermophilus]|uniref:Uncharacterized protein n=1 Tax=Dissulfuribacter thermophilus TaxID=1156395 RepID=A0A1B9F8F0_9BACT|nr:hypothetical protein [Dissulfuribacter thermophilus]OCC16085.1 hypothetical protein DBT_0547 [Dissulfuribacter thermophilus]